MRIESMNSKTAFLIVAFAVGTSGCVGGVESDGGEGLNPAAPDVTDQKGHVFRFRRHVAPMPAKVIQPIALPEEQSRPALDLDDDALAEARRPVMLKDGAEYIGDPAKETVALLRKSGRTSVAAFRPDHPTRAANDSMAGE